MHPVLELLTPPLRPDVAAPAVQYTDFIGLFLLCLVVMILVIAGVFVALAMNQVRRRRNEEEPARRRKWSSYGAHRPHFEPTARWLAIRSTNLKAVQEVLNLNDPVQCSWYDGVASASGRNLFVSPPVNNWILVFGSGIPDPASDIDLYFRVVSALSRELGEVQGYAYHKVVNHHAYARMVNGVVVRAYASAGDTLWDQGEITRAERNLGFQCPGYGESIRRDSPGISNAERISQLAARWSIDPTQLDEEFFLEAQGVAGNLYAYKLR